MEKKSSKKILIAFIVMTVVAVAALVFLGVMWASKVTYQNALENSYQKSYMSLKDNIDDIEVDLSKLVATTTYTSQKNIMQSIYASCVLAEENISSMPLSSSSLSNVNKLINKVAGYVYSLLQNETVVEGDVLTAIEGLHESVSVIKYDINKGYTDVLSEAVILSDATNSESGSSFTAGLVSGDGAYGSVPTLIYDGPFSESVMNKEPKVLEDKISQEEAYAKVSELTDYWVDYEVQYVGETNGKLDTYNYHLVGDNKVFLQVLQNGGKLLSATAYGDYSGEEVTIDEAIALSKKIAYDFGYEEMTDVWHQVIGSIVYINLAYTEDGVIYYSDLVKVKIDLNGGELVGWEATNYIYNHYERDEYEAALSMSAVQNYLSDSLEVVERNYCVVPNEYVGESNAYEYVCQWSGYTYYVYLDSSTGEELKIMRIIETDNGDLLE